jgi:hypothetical protein
VVPGCISNGAGLACNRQQLNLFFVFVRLDSLGLLHQAAPIFVGRVSHRAGKKLDLPDCMYWYLAIDVKVGKKRSAGALLLCGIQVDVHIHVPHEPPSNHITTYMNNIH